jgi:hypothetical protein
MFSEAFIRELGALTAVIDHCGVGLSSNDFGDVGAAEAEPVGFHPRAWCSVA